MQAEYDEGGSIGKRYRRQDEIGTPWCVTVDHQTLEDRTVTVRDRDSLEQERVAIDELAEVLAERLARRGARRRGQLAVSVAAAGRVCILCPCRVNIAVPADLIVRKHARLA